MKVVWSPTAKRQADAAVDYFARERPLGALNWLNGLVERIELLRELPDQGRVVPEWHQETVREVYWEPYRVIYEVKEGHIEILTLSHARQKLPDNP